MILNILVFLVWFGVGIYMQTKGGGGYDYSTPVVVYAIVTFNTQMMGSQAILTAASIIASIYADWKSDRESRMSAIGVCFSGVCAWFISVLPFVQTALTDDDGSMYKGICWSDNDQYCSLLKTFAGFACTCVALQVILLFHAINYDSQMKQQHDVINFAHFRPLFDRHVKWLYVLSFVGFLIWTISDFIITVGTSQAPLTIFMTSECMLFMAVCAVLPYAHSSASRMPAMIVFWITCFATVYGWSGLVYEIRATISSDVYVYCSTKRNWGCQTQAAAISGMAILILAETILCFVIAFTYLHESSPGPEGAALVDQARAIYHSPNAPVGGGSVVYGEPEEEGRSHGTG